MNKFYTFFITFLFRPALGHEIGIEKYSSGPYEENGFEYPASLTGGELEIIFKEIETVSTSPILYIKQTKDHFYEVVTCTKAESVMGECKHGDSFLFGQGKVAFSNFSITPGKIEFTSSKKETGEPVEPLEYSFGRYENVPFHYPSSLSEEQIELLVEKLSVHTKHEILSVYPSGESFSKYNIMTCTAGARIKYYCDAGESYEFDFGTYKFKTSGDWIQ